MKRILLLACFSVVITTPAYAQEQITLAQSKLFVAPTNAVQNTSEFISLPKGQDKLKLNLTYYNGTNTAPGFTTLRISSPSMNYVTEKAFVGGKTFTSDVTGDLTWGGNQIMITAEGPKGAEFGWRLTTPKPTITGITPPSVYSGGTVTINGTNLCSDLLSNDVEIGNKKAHCISASSDNIVVQIPEDQSGGSVNIAVNVAGLNAGTLPLNIIGIPYLKSLSQTWLPPGAELTIYGEGFDPNSAHCTVFMGPLQMPVLSSTATSITVTIPGGYGGMPWGFNQPLKVTINGVKARNTLLMSASEV